MFKLTNLTSSNVLYTKAPIFKLKDNTNLIPLVQIKTNKVDNTITPVKESYETIEYLENTTLQQELVIPVTDPNVYDVDTIEINGTTYTKATNELEVKEKEFSYSKLDKAVRVFLAEHDLFARKRPIKVNATKEKFVDNQIPITVLPNFLKQYPIKGSINIDRRFRDHPSCNFNLIATSKVEINYLDTLFNAYKYSYLFKNKFVFFNIPFRLRTYSVKESKHKDYPEGYYEVSISFEGWHQYLLNELIPLRNNVSTTTSTPFTDCQGSTNNDPVAKRDSNKKRVSFYTLAARGNINYLGSDYYYEYDKNTSKDAAISFSSELDRKLNADSKFALYSNEYITTPSWNGVSNFNIDSKESLSELSINYNSQTVSYQPSIFTWNTDEEDADLDNSENTLDNKIPEFEYKRPTKKTITTGDPNPQSPPANITTIQTMSLCCDNSGDRKTEIITTTEGQTLLKEEYKIYGFVYVARTIYNPEKGIYSAAGSKWTLIEHRIVDHLYDPVVGWYIGNNTTGWKLCRFNTESDSLETVNLDLTDATDTQRYQTYQFKQVPIKGHTRYLLRQFRDYYLNYPRKLPYIFYDYCTDSGKREKRYITDPTFAEDVFIGVEETYTNCFDKTENPESSEDLRLPPLTTGEVSFTTRTTKIVASKNVSPILSSFTDSGNLLRDNVIGSDFRAENDRYITFVKTFNSQDANYTNSTTQVSQEDSDGIPSQYTNRRPSPYSLKEEDGEVNLTTSETKINKNKSKPEYEYIIYTSPYTQDDVVSGSQSIEADTFQTAFDALKTQLAIQRTLQDVSISISVLYNPNLIEGYKCKFNYNNDVYYTRIIGVSHSIEIQGLDKEGNLVVSGTTNLQLGLEGNSNDLNYYKRVKDEVNAPNTKDTNPLSLTLRKVHEVGKEYGTLVDFATAYARNRGNF